MRTLAVTSVGCCCDASDIFVTIVNLSRRVSNVKSVFVKSVVARFVKVHAMIYMNEMYLC